MTLCIAAAAMIPACGDSYHRTGPRSVSAGPANSSGENDVATTLSDMGPIETIELLRDYRARGRYSAIEECLAPRQTETVIAQIRSVDRLIAAVSLLQYRVREHFGQAVAQKYEHYARVAGIAGVFSSDVALLGAETDGNRATVTFQVGDRLPLETADMVRKEDHWVLLADPVEGVPEQLLKLAFLIERMAQCVAQGKFTPQQLERELTLRQSTIIRRLQKLIAAAPKTV